MRRLPPRRRPFPLARLLIAGVGFLVLGVGWKLTNAEPAGAMAMASDVAPADYVPEDSDPGPAPVTIDPLGAADMERRGGQGRQRGWARHRFDRNCSTIPDRCRGNRTGAG